MSGPVAHPRELFERQSSGLTNRLTAWFATRIRQFPPIGIRCLLLLDLSLCLILPPWAAFTFRRWTGLRIRRGRFWKWYIESVQFALSHLMHSGKGTGLGMVKWSDGPIRSAQTKESPGHLTPGSCGSCTRCCRTSWNSQSFACPFLSKTGCLVYAGVWWDYFNCGRFPTQPVEAKAYQCPRFFNLKPLHPKQN